MCIICIKKPGVKLPDLDTISRMWTRNPHGAGFMWASVGGKRVHVRKGYMDKPSFIAALSQIPSPDDKSVILHFRITTHGGTRPENTHPFVITDDLPTLRSGAVNTRRVCFAHNGILPIKPRLDDISDTMEFAISRLTPISRMRPDFLACDDALELIADMSTGSRLAFLAPDGLIRTTGDFYEDARTGLIYSNTSFLPAYVWPALTDKRDLRSACYMDDESEGWDDETRDTFGLLY